ncbi:MAG TPA: elongation factor G [Geminicoccus sp.]|jgi:elongation factor G|uniref:elongation factor G n=1 Tax=Geminicoccus sp. TaxID=2024832 RepID=UPI002E2F1606|nr:elongation factor G [Geminicoccus sp.]HEX2525387.1 elongation factor G [Geminicoccus sp.]
MSTERSTRNLALVGPNGVGKSTLLESMLFVSGALPRKGRVADGTTVADHTPEARARRMSTEPTCATFTANGTKLTVIDCPGSVEFIHDTRAILAGVDAAVVVVEPIVERMVAVAPLLHLLDEIHLPHLVYVNKMDRSEVRWRDLLTGLRTVSQRPVIPHLYAIGRGEDLVGYVDLVDETAWHFNAGAAADEMSMPEEYREREAQARQEMLEALADLDDELLEQLLDDKPIDPSTVLRDLAQGLSSDRVVPVLLGVAERDMGVRRLLRAIVEEAPSPRTTTSRLGIAAEGPPLVQVLKTYHVPHAGKLSLARVWRGPLRDGAQIDNARVSGLFEVTGAKTEPVAEVPSGAIVGLGRMDSVHTGDILGASDGDAQHLIAMTPPQPMYAFALHAKDRNDEVKLSAAFQKLSDEDPAVRLDMDPETRQTVLWGQGEMHLRVALDRLRQKYRLELETHLPRTPYRETIRKGAQAHGRHKKQTGGHGQFADVKIEIQPRPRGQGFAFANKIVGGAVPKQFIPAVEDGAREALVKGPLGFPVVDVAVTLHDGQFHSVDSSELAFKLATGQALKEGLPNCQPVLLEPILTISMSVPSDYTSKALALISGKRGQVLGYEAKADWPGWDEISANLPQAESHDLVLQLRSMTQGVGFFTWRVDHLDEVPERLIRDIAAQATSAAP